MKMRPKITLVSDIYDYIYGAKGNCMLGITGSVNTGKSHMAVLIGYLSKKKNFSIDKSVVYSVENLVEKSLSFIKYKGKPLSFENLKDIEDTKKWIRENIQDITISPGEVIIMDEVGALGAYVRDFFSMDNKTLAKIIQIWRILRMLCIFVVPEDIGLADSTISKFLNFEVRMIGVDRKGNFAKCVAWEYTGWNKKQREPYRRRIRGCKGGGIMKVAPLPPELAAAYEDFSRSEKISALVDMGKEYRVNKPLNVASSKTIWDDINYVKKHADKFRNSNGRITTHTIMTNLGVSQVKASQIRSNLPAEILSPV